MIRFSIVQVLSLRFRSSFVVKILKILHCIKTISIIFEILEFSPHISLKSLFSSLFFNHLSFVPFCMLHLFLNDTFSIFVNIVLINSIDAVNLIIKRFNVIDVPFTLY